MSESESTYETQDLHLAAYLHAHGIRLVSIDHQGRRAAFLFTDPEECKKQALEYFNGEAVVDVRGYVRSLQELKSAIFNV